MRDSNIHLNNETASDLDAHFARYRFKIAAPDPEHEPDEGETEMPITVFRDAFRRSFPEKEDKPLRKEDLGEARGLVEALGVQYGCDAHCVAYYAPEHPGVRLSYSYLQRGLGVVHMTVLAIDIDTPGHALVDDEWLQAQVKLLEGLSEADGWGAPAAFYRTKHGIRAIWPLAEPVELKTEEDAAAWSRWYVARVQDLAKHGVKASADDRCKDWTRFFRLPNVIRDGERQPEAGILWGSEDAHGAVGLLAYDPPEPEESFNASINEGVSPNPKRTAALVELLRSIYPDLESGTCNEFRLASTGWLLRWGLGDAEIVAALNEARRRKGPLKGNWKETESRVASQRHKLISGEPLLGKTRMLELGEDPLPEKEREAADRAINEARVQRATDYLKKNPQHFAAFERMKEPQSAEDLSRYRIRAAIERFENEHLKAQLTKNKDGSPKSNYGNIERILREDVRLAGAIGFDELARKLVWLRRLFILDREISTRGRLRGDFHEVLEEEILALRKWIEDEYDCSPPKDSLFDAVKAVAKVHHSFHPITRYLESLEWDGTPRIDGFLARAVEPTNDNPEYVRLVSRRFLIAMAARGLSPGCKVDTMLILEGEQGAYKSQLCKTLAGGASYFNDKHPGVRASEAKAAQEYIQGLWLCEMAELASLRHADVDSLKSYLSSESDRGRAAYARFVEDVPRTCCFVGTVNVTKDGTGSDYLRDDSGERRFWPVYCGAERIDLRWVRENRDQLFAEAAHHAKRAIAALDAGETPSAEDRWWFDREDEYLRVAATDKRAERSEWEGILGPWASTQSSETHYQRAFRLPEAAVMVGVENDKVDTYQRKLGQCLRRLGYRRIRRRDQGSRQYFWVHEKFEERVSSGELLLEEKRPVEVGQPPYRELN